MTESDDWPEGFDITITPDGRLIVWYPGGIRDVTDIYVVGSDRGLFEAMRKSSAAKTLFMRLHGQTIYDPLTGLFRRDPARQQIEQRLQDIAAQQCTGSISVLCLDLDHFGVVNKRYGQQVGDEVLRWFARLLRKLRNTDIAVRWGGEEFLVFTNAFELKESRRTEDKRRREKQKKDIGITSEDAGIVINNGVRLASRIMRMVRAAPCIVGGQRIEQTVTIGVSTKLITTELEPEGLFDLLFDDADAVLRAGKNSDKRDAVHEARKRS